MTEALGCDGSPMWLSATRGIMAISVVGMLDLDSEEEFVVVDDVMS